MLPCERKLNIYIVYADYVSRMSPEVYQIRFLQLPQIYCLDIYCEVKTNITSGFEKLFLVYV